ncbi:PatB family C-S lyase [Geomonas sp. Red32]|uniref:MalY/PatB family protein n=1 Tax=Geomonas sp. Red32 TaxID=2912856 RepID=UPI00202CF5A3|nr:PatB family C-S lyase [Geomonas sp. Red32]MCM0083560.1 PatB family C-S lyase [Geomonas sp. Red32]
MSTNSTFDFDTVIDRSNTGSEKWDKYLGRDIIPLWVADMDFRSPPAVIEALHKRVEHGVFGYSYPDNSLVEAVRGALKRDYDWEIEEEWIVWLPGLVCGLNVLCRAIGEPGDEVVTLIPVYPPFMSAPVLTGRTAIKVPLVLEEGRWVTDFEALEQAITPATKLLLLCNPHNPVGRAWTREELLRFADVAQRHGLVIGSDDIHSELILDDVRHLPIASLSPEIAERTITLLAPSKTYNVPGLGCSFAVISNPQLRRQFRQAMGRLVPHVNTLGYTAAEAAYRDGAGWRAALLDYLRGNRDLVEAEVAAMPALKITHVEATYLAWIDARELGVENPGRFFEEAGVGLSDGADFGAPGFVRLNFGCSRKLLSKALARMRQALPG